MKWVALASTVLVAAGSSGGGIPASIPGPDTLTTSYQVAGLHVIQRVNRSTDIVAARLYLLGGTRQLTEATAGIEALLLAATGYGTARYPGEQAQRAMARTGSVVEITSDADWSVFGFTGLAVDFDTAWAVFAERITKPTLTALAINQARNGLINSAHRRYTDPDERIQVIAARAMFPGHPYSLDPEGTEASLRGITTDQVRAYARDELVTSRMLLVIVGNVERAHAESLIAATLGRLPEGTYQWTLPPPAPKLPSRWLVEHRLLPTDYILCYFSGPPPNQQDYWAFRVATALLSSQLNYQIREQHSLSYDAYAPFFDRALPIGGAYASTTKPDRVLPLMQGAVRTLQGAEFDYFALRRFLNSFSFDYLVENATAADQADFLARAELLLGGFRKGDDFVKRMRNVAPDDIKNAAGVFMARLQYAYLGDTMRMKGHW
ncbi:MAG TPA: pitrilysin family protein [Gemmatimonadales bacterium]